MKDLPDSLNASDGVDVIRSAVQVMLQELAIPKLRSGSFFPCLLERRRRISQSPRSTPPRRRRHATCRPSATPRRRCPAARHGRALGRLRGAEGEVPARERAAPSRLESDLVSLNNALHEFRVRGIRHAGATRTLTVARDGAAGSRHGGILASELPAADLVLTSECESWSP